MLVVQLVVGNVSEYLRSRDLDRKVTSFVRHTVFHTLPLTLEISLHSILSLLPLLCLIYVIDLWKLFVVVCWFVGLLVYQDDTLQQSKISIQQNQIKTTMMMNNY